MNMNQGTVYVDCPCCGTRLEVERENGKVVQQWKKAEPAPGGDALKAALAKLESDKQRRQQIFSTAKESMEEQKRKALEKFEKEKERIKRENDTSRPPGPFDLD